MCFDTYRTFRPNFTFECKTTSLDWTRAGLTYPSANPSVSPSAHPKIYLNVSTQVPTQVPAKRVPECLPKYLPKWISKDLPEYYRRVSWVPTQVLALMPTQGSAWVAPQVPIKVLTQVNTPGSTWVAPQVPIGVLGQVAPIKWLNIRPSS